MSEQTIDKDLDLPLMANVEDIRVQHYMMRLSFDFESDTVEGEAILFCIHLDHNAVKNPSFEFLLDCRHIDFTDVSQVLDIDKEKDMVLSSFEPRKSLEMIKSCFQKQTSRLNFTTDPWSLRISRSDQQLHFPQVFRISWRTQNGAKSLMWRTDQKGNKCTFTAAAAVNNRSLFPCQEPPIALASWQCLIRTSKKLTVLCTGDEDAVVNDGEHYFFTQMVLPMSTFAVAIGHWDMSTLVSPSLEKIPFKEEKQCRKLHEPYPCHVDKGDSGPLIKCRLFGPSELVSKVEKVFSLYLSASLKSSYELLGPHPFQKLDIVIIPRCFSGLGLASPNLMFVSQSLLLDSDCGMMIRISHEISHNWFGLLIGAKDWTEEWLTEGFATFAEDFIHTQTMKKLGRKFGAYPANADASFWQNLSELRCLIRYETLKNEVTCTPTDHQIIRPMKGQELCDEGVKYVKNGQNPEMAYTQVHYLKGYFLLHFLCDAAGGEEKFFAFLRHYAHDLYHGKLVHSTDFLRLYFETFADTFNQKTVQENIDDICRTWLDTEILPAHIAEKCQRINNPLLTQVKKMSQTFLTLKRKSKESGQVGALLPEQMILFLEEMIKNAEKLSLPCQRRLMSSLSSQIKFSECNADIQHRWCELIVLFDFKTQFSFINNFLREHQAMGVYLYSEMMMSQNDELKKMAKNIFDEISWELDTNTRENVQNMLLH